MRQARVRVELRWEGACQYMDFNTGEVSTLPTMPNWMQDSIALLNIAGIQVEVPGVGMRWEDTVYYLTIKGDF